MENNLYMDIVSQTIISKLSEEISQQLISQINEANRSFLINDLPDIVAREIKEQTSQIETKIKSIEDHMDSALDGMKKSLEKNSQDNLEYNSKLEQQLNKLIIKELQKAQQAIQDEGKSGIEALKNAINHELQNITDKTDQAVSSLNDSLSSVGMHTEKVADSLNDELKNYARGQKDIKENIEKQGEFLTGMFYALKKQINASVTEKEEAEKFKTKYLEKQNELYDMIMDSEETRKQQSLLNEMKKQVSALNDRLGYSTGNGDNLISLIEHKNKQQLNELKSGLMDEFANILVKQLESDHTKDDRFQKELNELKETIHANDSEQHNLLNTIYYSTKKMSKSIGKEKGEADKSEIKFMNELEVLYGHIRRLESEKDDLGLELLRLGGDAYQKEKLTSIEKEMKKQKALSEKYLNEKKEIEARMVQMEELWENSIGTEDRP